MIRTMICCQPVRAGLVLCAVLCGSATVANAYTIYLTGGSSGGNPGGQPLYGVSGLVQGDAFNVAWGGASGVGASGMVSIESLTATTADIRVMLDNMSTPISGSDPRVTSVGFDIDGYSSLASTATGGTDLDLADTSNFPGFGTLTCGTSGSNCAGGGSGGVPAGGSDDFTLQVNGTFPGTLTLESFALKIQGGPSGNSFELAGVPRPKVPEPTSIGLAAFGLAALAMKWRSRR
jgi:PEP-CTERM motif